MIGLLAVQGVLGLVMFISGSPRGPREGILHIVYGIFAIVFLPGVFFYVARGDRRREAAFLAAACWIVVVAFGRGITTG